MSNGCFYFYFIVFLCMFGNGLGIKVAVWESDRNGSKIQTVEWERKGMGINWMGMKGMGIRKSILVISTDMADNVILSVCFHTRSSFSASIWGHSTCNQISATNGHSSLFCGTSYPAAPSSSWCTSCHRWDWRCIASEILTSAYCDVQRSRV